jgi:hypothetical protein
MPPSVPPIEAFGVLRSSEVAIAERFRYRIVLLFRGFSFRAGEEPIISETLS